MFYNLPSMKCSIISFPLDRKVTSYDHEFYVNEKIYVTIVPKTVYQSIKFVVFEV